MTIAKLRQMPENTLRAILISYYQANNWKIDDKFNLVGLREKDNVSNIKYCDLVGSFSYNTSLIRPGTTQPGIFYADKPLNPLGTAHVMPGFYSDVFVRGIHNRGKASSHQGFIQAGKFSFRRDLNRNGKIEFYEPVMSGAEQGINLHSQFGDSENIGLWGAACQVLEDMEDLKKLNAQADESGLKCFNYGIILVEEL